MDRLVVYHSVLLLNRKPVRELPSDLYWERGSDDTRKGHVQRSILIVCYSPSGIQIVKNDLLTTNLRERKRVLFASEFF